MCGCRVEVQTCVALSSARSRSVAARNLGNGDVTARRPHTRTHAHAPTVALQLTSRSGLSDANWKSLLLHFSFPPCLVQRCNSEYIQQSHLRPKLRENTKINLVKSKFCWGRVKALPNGGLLSGHRIYTPRRTMPCKAKKGHGDWTDFDSVPKSQIPAG